MPPGEKRIRTLLVDDSADYVRYRCAFLETLSNVDVIAKGPQRSRRVGAGSRMGA
jgi:hypothetical protein